MKATEISNKLDELYKELETVRAMSEKEVCEKEVCEKYKVSIDRKESKITITAIPVKKL